MRFETSRIRYESFGSRFTTTERVHFFYRGMTMEGDGMEARTESASITLPRNVSGRIEMKR